MPIRSAAGCRKALRIRSIATHGRLLLCVLAPLCLWLSGCSAGMAPGPAFMASYGISGRLMGGQQPVSGANIILWMVNTNGSAASSLMTSSVSSDANGNFVLTGKYSTSACTSTTQVYITATGGNPGAGVNNALALVAALGPCLSLTSSTYIVVNEVTTVAAVFALHQFFGATQGSTFAEGIATSSSTQSVQGMINAFQTAQLLANVSSGTANATVGNASIEATKINTLANIVATCVNSSGISSTGCQQLFSYATPANSPSPGDTIQALLYIAANPAHNVASLFGLPTANPPFANALTAAPFDWTLGVTYTSDGLNLPGLLASDANGDVWIADGKSGAESLVEMTPSGAPASGSPFLVNMIDLPQAVVPDTLGHIWMTALGTNSSDGNRLFSFNPTTSTATTYTLPTNCGPEAMAIDGSDDLFFTCTTLGYLYEFPNQTSGTPSATNLPSYPASPTQLGTAGTQDYLAIDALGNVWLGNASSSKVSDYAAGSYGAASNTFTVSTGPLGLAIDHSNNAWVTSGSYLVEYAYNSGTAYTAKTFSGGGLNAPQYIAVDGAGNIWIANSGVTTISSTQYISVSEFNNSGVALSPASVSGTSPGGFSHVNSASSPSPRGITIDPSGNVWMAGCGLSSSCANSTSFVLEIVGAASPPVVPLATAIASNQLGCCSFTPAPPPSTSTFPPTIDSFTASPTRVAAGQPVTLTWTVSDASSTQVSGISGSLVSPITVYPSASGSYTLTATNVNGSVSQTVSITVTSTTQIASATIASTPGQLVPSNFMGLGIGPTSWESTFGEPATGTNPVLRQILNNITQFGASPVSYKITSYDQYPASSATYVPTTADVSALNQLYADTGTTFYVGINLAADSLSIAEAQTQAFASLMTSGSLVGVEIGNEPDLYVYENYRSEPYYFLEDYAPIRAGVLTTLQTYQPSTVKIIGPAWGEPLSLTGGFHHTVNDSGNPITIGDYLSQESSNLSLVTQHAYANQCDTSYNSSSPPVDYLLQASAQNCVTSSYLLAGVAPTHADGLKYRIGETNSINGGGVSGISNTFEASLWVMDYCARLAQNGVDGVNIFGDTTVQYYTMFTFNQVANGTTTYTLNYVLPQYYGVLMFQQATQNKAQFLPVNPTATGNQVIYAWLDASNTIRILVLNKDESGSGTVTLTLPSGYGSGAITRLLEAVPNASPAYQSTSGVTLGGQSFDASVLGTEATNGVIQGKAYGEIIVPSSNAYTFSMPVTSAVLLTVPHS